MYRVRMTGWVVLVCCGLLLVAAGSRADDTALGRQREANFRAQCQNNLKQIGLVLKMYANESKRQYFPVLSGEKGRLMFRKDDVCPEYLTDATLLACPASESAPSDKAKETPEWYFGHSGYWYLGYAVREKTAQAFIDAYKAQAAKAGGFEQDLPLKDGASLPRLREGVERTFVTDVADPSAAATQAFIPVLIERPGHHKPEGGNVLFMDGHVEFLKYPSKFPMTEAFINGLKSLDELGGKPKEAETSGDGA